MKANFIDINDTIFSKRKKICNVPDFPSIWRLVVKKTRAKIAQHSDVFASNLEDASLAAIFFALNQNLIVQLYCVQSLVGKGYFLAPNRARKGLCIVCLALIMCLALAAILPFRMTSPRSHFW